MGCNATSGVVRPLETTNIEHRIVHLVVTDQTDYLIDLIKTYEF